MTDVDVVPTLECENMEVWLSILYLESSRLNAVLLYVALIFAMSYSGRWSSIEAIDTGFIDIQTCT